MILIDDQKTKAMDIYLRDKTNIWTVQEHNWMKKGHYLNIYGHLQYMSALVHKSRVYHTDVLSPLM